MPTAASNHQKRTADRPALRIPRHLERKPGTLPPSPGFLADSPEIRARVLAVLVGHLDGLPFGKLSARLGGVSSSKLKFALQALLLERKIARVIQMGDAKYRLPLAGEDLMPGPPVRSIPVPAFDPEALTEAVIAAFTGQHTFNIQELVLRAKGKSPHANMSNVQATVNILVGLGTVERLPLGAFTRYRARVSRAVQAQS